MNRGDANNFEYNNNNVFEIKFEIFRNKPLETFLNTDENICPVGAHKLICHSLILNEISGKAWPCNQYWPIINLEGNFKETNDLKSVGTQFAKVVEYRVLSEVEGQGIRF